jgi:hypothetical protein
MNWFYHGRMIEAPAEFRRLRNFRCHLAGLGILFLSLSLFKCLGAEDGGALHRQEWTVDGIVREALVYAPAKAKQETSPVVFVFKGHGGNKKGAARTFK